MIIAPPTRIVGPAGSPNTPMPSIEPTKGSILMNTPAAALPTRLAPMFHATDGVQCEACHGPGQRYRMKTTMKKIWEEMGGDSSKPSATDSCKR